MKNFIYLFFCFFILSTTAQNKKFKDFYKEHKKEAEVSLNIPGFIAKIFTSNTDDDLSSLLEKSKNYKILVFNKNTNKVQQDFKTFASKNKLKSLLRVKEGNNRVFIYYKEDNNIIKEIIINAYDKNKELVFLALKTSLSKREFKSMMDTV